MSDLADQIHQNIESIASQATARKSPSANSGSGEAQTVFYTEAAEAPPQPAQPNAPKPGELGEKEIKASGKTGAFLTAGLIEAVFGLGESLLHTTRFTAPEKERLITLDEVSTDQWTEDDDRLNRKFLALTKKHEKIKEKIELKPDEVEALEIAFAEHTRITGKSLNPQLIVWSTIGKIFVNRSIDIFL